MRQHLIAISPFKDQRPGTSGLRKKVAIFRQPHYLASFIQAIFNKVGAQGASFVLGGDGRFFMAEALQIIIKMALANKVKHLIIGQDGLLSTPAASHLIRRYKAKGGFILSASHNAGGANGDFGVKYNLGHGGAASLSLCEEFYAESQILSHYNICELQDIDLSKAGIFYIGDSKIEIIDSVKFYSDFMEQIFDFPAIKRAQQSGLSFYFDALHGVSGPYAREIFINRLGFAENSLNRANNLPDFGGCAPDPSLENLAALYNKQMSDKAADLAAASDGDGDRNFIMGKGQYVSPSDALAILLDHAHLLPFYRDRIFGVARSLPTSRAVDKVAQFKSIPCYQTPTGWKFFANLLEAQKISLCGEESFGTGSFHSREKDGIWAVLFWLNILALSKKSIKEIVHHHWQLYGRHYHSRFDLALKGEGPSEAQIMAQLYEHLCQARSRHALKSSLDILRVEDFCYRDITDGTLTQNQGLELELAGNRRIIYRLSGTGTGGAILRIYLEAYSENYNMTDSSPAHLANLLKLARDLAGL